MHRDRLASLANNLAHNSVSTRLAGGIIHHHRRPLRGQLFRNRGAYSLRCTCHHGHFTLKLAHHHSIVIVTENGLPLGAASHPESPRPCNTTIVYQSVFNVGAWTIVVKC